MDYKELFLDVLNNTFLSKGIEFHEGHNDSFMNYVNNYFPNFFTHAYGASKFVLIPKDPKIPYVIKIPYTGSYYEEASYLTKTGYYSGRHEYIEFFQAENNERNWDYCAVEVERYNIATQYDLEKYFAKTQLLDFVRGYPVYIQERGITFSGSRNSHVHSHLDILKTIKEIPLFYHINQDWLTDFRLCYGTEKLKIFIDFIQKLNWDDDLRNENIGYINNLPVIIDYSSFNE